jgi:penicillin-binding protein-related factor A (putative recombinase)
MASSHANRGMAWEDQLARQHSVYTDAKTAIIRKNEKPVVLERHLGEGRYIARLKGSAPPDYLILCGGWTIWADAKESRERYWSFKYLEPHQANDLDAINALGERYEALLLLHSAALHRAFVIAWADLSPRWRAWEANKAGGGRAAPGGGSLSWDEAGDLALWTGRTFFADPDYLPSTIAKLEARRAPAQRADGVTRA